MKLCGPITEINADKPGNPWDSNTERDKNKNVPSLLKILLYPKDLLDI